MLTARGQRLIKDFAAFKKEHYSGGTGPDATTHIWHSIDGGQLTPANEHHEGAPIDVVLIPTGMFLSPEQPPRYRVPDEEWIRSFAHLDVVPRQVPRLPVLIEAPPPPPEIETAAPDVPPPPPPLVAQTPTRMSDEDTLKLIRRHRKKQSRRIDLEKITDEELDSLDDDDVDGIVLALGRRQKYYETRT